MKLLITRPVVITGDGGVRSFLPGLAVEVDAATAEQILAQQAGIAVSSNNAFTTILRFVGVGSVCGPLVSLRAGLVGQEWNRLPEESEEAFIARVEMATSVRAGCQRLLIGR